MKLPGSLEYFQKPVEMVAGQALVGEVLDSAQAQYNHLVSNTAAEDKAHHVVRVLVVAVAAVVFAPAVVVVVVVGAVVSPSSSLLGL